MRTRCARSVPTQRECAGVVFGLCIGLLRACERAKRSNILCYQAEAQREAARKQKEQVCHRFVVPVTCDQLAFSRKGLTLKKQPRCIVHGCKRALCTQWRARRLTAGIRYAINDLMRAQEWAVYLRHSTSEPASVADDDSDSDHSPKGYMSPMKRSPSRCVVAALPLVMSLLSTRTLPFALESAPNRLRFALVTRLSAEGCSSRATVLLPKAAHTRPCGQTVYDRCKLRPCTCQGSACFFRFSTTVYSTLTYRHSTPLSLHRCLCDKWLCA
jgi:hypothetical protein